MTSAEWINYAREHQEALEYLIENWHPITQKAYGDMSISAPNAERACQSIRKQIKEKEPLRNPLGEFRQALLGGDILRMNNLLNEVWFGVPESTDCWQLKGFKEAVHLMEDLPE